MGNELCVLHSTTALSIYATIRNNTGGIYSSGVAGFEAYTTANFANYALALTEQGTASRVYAGNMPGIIGGTYKVGYYVQVGGGPSESADTLIDTERIEWGGSSIQSLASVVSYLTDLQSRLPVALIGGRMDSCVSDLASSSWGTLADAILDRASGVQSGVTLRQAMVRIYGGFDSNNRVDVVKLGGTAYAAALRTALGLSSANLADLIAAIRL